jgi:glycosyltransferase involved in cell wall biosynthesis
MTDLRPEPRISVLIPAFERARELRLCLEGFRNQTLEAEAFEVIVVDDGSSSDLSPVASSITGLRLEFRRSEHAGPSVARNIALNVARAPLLLLYDDDIQPLPGLLEYCLEFHQRHPENSAAALLYFTQDLSVTPFPFEEWAFTRLYPFPASAGIYRWLYFWSGSVTCKRSLLADCTFNPRYRSIEDAELAFRLSQRGPLAVHFEPRPGGLFLRRLTFDEVCRRQRQMAYYRFRMAADGNGIQYPHPVYAHPEEYLVQDPALLQTAKALASRGGVAISPLASALWTMAENHAIATGWLAAQRGVPPEAL